MGLYQVDPTLKPLIDALIERRRSLGLSQLDVDRRAGWAVGLCAKYECGMRTPGMIPISIWAEALNAHLIVHTDEVPNTSSVTAAHVLRTLEPRGVTLKLAENLVQLEHRTVKEVKKLVETARHLAQSVESLDAHCASGPLTIQLNLDRFRDRDFSE